MKSTKKVVFSIKTILLVLLTQGFVFPADAQDNDVTVCVGADSILRSPDSGTCPSGSQKFKLSGPDINKPNDADNDPLGPTQEPGQSKSDPLADVQRRLSNLEKPSVFEVVDQQDRTIFSVAPGRALLYTKGGAAVAAMGATPDGGMFVARTADAKLTTFIRALEDRVGFRLKDGDFTSVDLGRQEAGNYSFKIPLGDNAIAGIGESKAGTGAVIIGDGSGRTRAAMEVNDRKGALDVFNVDGNCVASLTESVNGGGLLVLTDAASRATVMMKANKGYGVVMTFPPGFPYVPKSGLPGSYMLGCAGGPACVP